MKICKKCNQSLDEFLFNKNKTKSDGFEIYCKECAKIKSKLANTMKWDANFKELVNFANWINLNIKPILEKEIK